MLRKERRFGITLEDVSGHLTLESDISEMSQIASGEFLFHKQFSEIGKYNNNNNFYFWLNNSLKNFTLSFDICFVSDIPNSIFIGDRYSSIRHSDWIKECVKDTFTHIEIKMTKIDKCFDFIMFNTDGCREEVILKIKNIMILSDEVEKFDYVIPDGDFMKIFCLKEVPFEFLDKRTLYLSNNYAIYRNSNYEVHIKKRGDNTSKGNLKIRLNNDASDILLSFEIKIIIPNDSLMVEISQSGNKYHFQSDKGRDTFSGVSLLLHGENSPDENFASFVCDGEVDFFIQKIKTSQPPKDRRNIVELRKSNFSSRTDEEKKLCTVILQGNLNANIDLIKTISDYSKNSEIIISTYDLEEYKGILNSVREKFPLTKIIFNDIEENFNTMRKMGLIGIEKNHPNVFHQLESTRKAIELVTTDFVIKTRGDSYFCDLDEFLYEMTLNPDKILSSSLFVRGLKYCKYHPSDILFGGKTENMKDLIFSAFDDLYYNSQTLGKGIPEELIHRSYILKRAKMFDLDVENDDQYLQVMLHSYKIFCINRHSSYIFRGNRESSCCDLDKSTKDYLIWGCMM